MPFKKLFQAKLRAKNSAHGLYVALVEQARTPDFYSELLVPDTLDGRFDMIVLHTIVVMRRLRSCGEDGQKIAQALFDLMFRDMDRSLRELGVGDHAIGRRIKQMVSAFYGRARAYESALSGEQGDIIDALRRNVYRETPEYDAQATQLADYLVHLAGKLDAQDSAELLAGQIHFPPFERQDMGRITVDPVT